MSEEIFENAVILAGKELEPIEGYFIVEDGVIQEIGEGNPPNSGTDLEGAFVIPPFVNSHTHIADSIRKDLYRGKNQAETVCEGGEKFKTLAEASDEEKIEAMKETLLEMKNSGIPAHLDFREGGLEGVELLRRAEIENVESIILSRPESVEEVGELLESSDGVGLPSLDFCSEEELEEIAGGVSKEDKLFSVHVSETREAHEKSLEEKNETETQRALELDPNHLVHGVHSTGEDLRAMKKDGVPLVLCARANSLLGVGLPPIKEALENGVEIWLGTDNATVCSPDMFRELSFAWSILRLQSNEAGKEEARELLKAATVNPARSLGLFGLLEEGEEAGFVVLSRERNLDRCEDPYVGIVSRARRDNVEMIYSPLSG